MQSRPPQVEPLLVILGGHVDSTGYLGLGCSDSEYWLLDKVKKLESFGDGTAEEQRGKRRDKEKKRKKEKRRRRRGKTKNPRPKTKERTGRNKKKRLSENEDTYTKSTPPTPTKTQSPPPCIMDHAWIFKKHRTGANTLPWTLRYGSSYAVVPLVGPSRTHA